MELILAGLQYIFILNESETIMKKLKNLVLFFALAVFTSQVFAADGDAPRPKYVDPNPWTHKTKKLNRAEFDKLLGHPEKLLILDLRRPDELVRLGGFPVYLSIQNANLQESLDYIPKDRTIVTVSNRAHRAGVAGDILLENGYKVAGAVGVEDYKDENGWIKIITPPPPPAPKTDAAAAVSPSAQK